VKPTPAPRSLLALVAVLMIVLVPAPHGAPVDQPTASAPTATTPAGAGRAEASTAAPPGPAQAQRAELVQELLTAWAAAERTNDTAALAGLMDSAADPAFRSAEATRAANLTGVPLREWDYQLVAEPAPVVPPVLVQRLGAQEVWAPPVVLRYAVSGVDALATSRTVGLVVARRGGQWRLVTDTALTDYGRRTWRGPWDFGPVLVRSSDQGVVFGHPGAEPELDAVAEALRTAVPAVTDFWGTGWPRQALVVLTSSRAELVSLVGEDFAGAGVAAVTTADAVNRAAGTAAGVRVVADSAAVRALNRPSLSVVLRHELTHVATRTITADQAPLWMLEGFADYAGYRGSGTAIASGAPEVAQLVRTVGAPTALPVDADFAPTGPTTRAALAYQLSWTFAEFLAQTRGEAALIQAYRSVAALAAPTSAQVDAALSAAGAPTDVLVAQWGQWLAAQLG